MAVGTRFILNFPRKSRPRGLGYAGGIGNTLSGLGTWVVDAEYGLGPRFRSGYPRPFPAEAMPTRYPRAQAARVLGPSSGNVVARPFAATRLPTIRYPVRAAPITAPGAALRNPGVAGFGQEPSTGDLIDMSESQADAYLKKIGAKHKQLTADTEALEGLLQEAREFMGSTGVGSAGYIAYTARYAGALKIANANRQTLRRISDSLSYLVPKTPYANVTELKAAYGFGAVVVGTLVLIALISAVVGTTLVATAYLANQAIVSLTDQDNRAKAAIKGMKEDLKETFGRQFAEGTITKEQRDQIWGIIDNAERKQREGLTGGMGFGTVIALGAAAVGGLVLFSMFGRRRR